MLATRLNNSLRLTLLALALSAWASLASASTLHVEIDTSSLSNSGWIDLTFNAATGRTPLASADLSHFVGFNAATGAQASDGVTGSLTSGYSLSNSGGGSDLFHSVNFGGKVAFDVSFSGALDPLAYHQFSTLSVAMYGADQSTLLGHGDAGSGALVQLYWLPSTTSAQGGSTSYKVFDNLGGVSPVTAVPEPSSWMMLGAGLGVLGLVRRRKTAATFQACATTSTARLASTPLTSS